MNKNEKSEKIKKGKMKKTEKNKMTRKMKKLIFFVGKSGICFHIFLDIKIANFHLSAGCKFLNTTVRFLFVFFEFYSKNVNR